MADDKRNRGDEQQGGNQDRDRQRQQRDRKPGGGGSMETPGSSDQPRKDDELEQE
jgi:hypothetical protein